LPTKPGKTHLGLEEAHRDLHISPAEFDEVAAELGGSLDFAKVPAREKAEVLAAFAAHKDEANLEVEGDLTSRRDAEGDVFSGRPNGAGERSMG
jgi:hypothetical protein